MSITIRGVTYAAAADLPGTIALPAGTTTGDWLLLVFDAPTTGDLVYPDEDTVYGYTPSAGAGVWQVITAYSALTQSCVVCLRKATADDVADDITVTGDGDTAVLIAFTGDDLMELPSTWGGTGWTGGSYIGPAHAAATGWLIGTTATAAFEGRPDSVVVYVSILSQTDADAELSTGTLLLNSPGTQKALASYDTVTTLDTVTASVTTSFTASTSPYRDAKLFALLIQPMVTVTSNDTFAAALPIELAAPGDTYVSPMVDNRTFGTETGEPMGFLDPDSIGLRSAWWTYTPDADGEATFDTDLSPDWPFTVLGVYTGSAVNSLTEVGYDDDGGAHSSLVTLDVVADTTYHIKVGSYSDEDYDDTLYVLRATGPSSVGAAGLSLTVPPIEVDAEGRPPTNTVTTNDFFVDAFPVLIDDDGDTFTSLPYGNASNTTQTGEPGTESLARSAWWIYTPYDNGEVVIDTAATPTEGGFGDLRLRLYTGATLDDLFLIAESDASLETDPVNVAKITFQATAGTPYAIQVGQNHVFDDPTDVVLSVTGPHSTGDPPAIVAVPPMDATASFPAPTAIEFTVVAYDPPQGTTVPTRRPTFTVAVNRSTNTSDTITIEVRVQDVADGFATVYTLSTEAVLTSPTTYVRLAATTDLETGEYVWQARGIYAGHTFDWQPFLTSFITVDPADISFGVPVTCVVEPGTPAPHLWFVIPAAGTPGDIVTAVGHGFGDSGTVTLAGLEATVEDWDLVAATANSTGRTIDPSTGTVDAEHYAVTLVVPDAPPPGGALIVES